MIILNEIPYNFNSKGTKSAILAEERGLLFCLKRIINLQVHVFEVIYVPGDQDKILLCCCGCNDCVGYLHMHQIYCFVNFLIFFACLWSLVEFESAGIGEYIPWI